MPLSILILLSAITVITSAVRASTAMSGRVKYQPCGYRMIRHKSPSGALVNAFGVGAFGGLSIVLLGVALLG